MPDFLQSNDFLRRDGLFWPAARVSICLALVLVWVYWFCFARIGIYEVSDTSQVEVSQEIHPVQVETDGRVSRNLLVLGKTVQAGELLLEMDDSEPRLDLNELQARLSGIDPQLSQLYSEIESQRGALQHENDELVEAQRQAESVSREAQARSAFAGHQAEQYRQLHSIGTLSRLEMDRAIADAHEQAAAAEGAHASVTRAGELRRRSREERWATIHNLEKQAATLAADRRTLTAQVKRVQHELERRQVYAPVAGTLAEVESIEPGMFVKAGQKVATILPLGELKVVAQFQPAAVPGRVKPSQPARLLVERFSWSQYGAVPLTVQTVGTDVQNERIKVELSVDPSFHSNIPLQHGLRGTTEVLVERATPLAIALRVAGRYLAVQPQLSHGDSSGPQ